jgi:hypothetical protein
MSTGSPKLARREQAIEAARRRLRRIEIEQHRIKAALARLEADYEDDVADWLSRKIRRRASSAGIVERPARTTGPVDRDGGSFAPPFAVDLNPRNAATESKTSGIGRADGPKRVPTGSPRREISTPVVHEAPPAFELKTVGHRTTLDRNSSRRGANIRTAASPLLCSFALHAVVLSLCVTFTIATIVQQEVPLLSTPADLDESFVEDFSNVEVPPTKFDDAEIQNVVYESPDFHISDRMKELEPSGFGMGTQALGDIGQLDALPSELGTLMAGAGSPGRGTPGGAPGEATFFGARSKGDRFVFVVDNSSSMKGGRLEAATAELIKATNALTPRQSFYVIFVSDQTYPMFFPQREPDLVPATPPNKQRLAEWLPKAILASGNNRKLIDAMDMAAALRPHAVFLLWDGDMKYSEKVRLDVMTHLTRPNQWNFTIHTLGMGVASLDAEQNLTTIAQAHGGTFRRVDVPTVRGR